MSASLSPIRVCVMRLRLASGLVLCLAMNAFRSRYKANDEVDVAEVEAEEVEVEEEGPEVEPPSYRARFKTGSCMVTINGVISLVQVAIVAWFRLNQQSCTLAKEISSSFFLDAIHEKCNETG